MNYIDAESHEFLISELEDGIGTIIILTPNANFYLNKMILNFTKLFPLEIIEEISIRGLDSSVEKKLMNLISKCFPTISEGGVST